MMKTIEELRKGLDFKVQELSTTLKYISKQNLDFNVFLPTKNKNLQRDFVWTIEQKRELIYSMLIERHIPHFAMVDIIDQKDKSKSILQVIDGKQRLSSLLSFYNDEYTVELEGKEYYFKDLPKDYQFAISHRHLRYYVVYEDYKTPMTDEQKIQWFKFINFAGTKQDEEHLKNL